MILKENLNHDYIIHMLDGIQQLIGANCEIIVHDFRQGFDNSIVHTVNSELSGREIGGRPRGAMIMNFGKDIELLKESKILFYKGKKGQIYKSCSTLIADNSNKVIGSICINIEVSQLMAMNTMMNDFLDVSQQESNLPDKSAITAQNVDDVLQFYLHGCEKLLGTTMELMTKEQKIEALDYLDQRGVFKISKANVLLCERFQISKYTLYNYLDEAKRRNQEDANDNKE